MVSAGAYLYASAGTKVLRISKTDGAWTSVAGSGGSGYVDGVGTQAWFRSIGGIDSDGTNLWVTDTQDHRIRKLTPHN